MTKTDIHKKAMIEALEKSLGVVTMACKKVGISRETHYRWYREDDNYKDAVDNIADIALDFGESQLHKRMEKGSDAAIIFYLKTRGKNRGYVERQEIQQETTFKSLDINIIEGDIPLATSEKDIKD